MTMGHFESNSDVYDVLGTFFKRSATDESVGPEIQKSGIVIQFEYTDPQALITVDAKSTVDGAFYNVIEGQTEIEPDVRLSMSADIANQFWQGKLNAFMAVAKRQVVVHGPMGLLMKLMPAMEPAYAKYRAYLQEIGRQDLLV